MAEAQKVTVQASLAQPSLKPLVLDERAKESHAPKYLGEVLPRNASRKELEKVFSQYPPEIQAKILQEAGEYHNALDQRFSQWRVLRAALEEKSRKGEAKGDTTFEIIRYHWGKHIWGGENSYYQKTENAKEQANKFLAGAGGENAKNSPAQIVEHYLNSGESLENSLILAGAYDPNGIVRKTVDQLGLNVRDVVKADNAAAQIAQDQLKLIQHLRTQSSHNSVELTSLAALSPLVQKKIAELSELSPEERTKIENDAHNRITEIFRKNDTGWRHPSTEMIARGAVEMNDALISQKKAEAIEIEKSMSLTRAAMGKVNEEDLKWLKDKYPDLAPIWKEFNDACDPRGEWFNLSDANKNFLTEELIVNGILIAASGGVAGIGAAAIRGVGVRVFGKIVLEEGVKMTARQGARALAGRAALLGAEGAIFEFAHHGLTHGGESLTNDESCMQRILWSTATLGLLKGTNALTQGVNGIRLGQVIEGQVFNNFVKRAGAESAKFTIRTSAETGTLTIVEGTKQSLNGGNFTDALDAQQLAHAFLTAGSLKVGHVAAVNGPRWCIQVGKRVFTGKEVSLEPGGPMLPPPAGNVVEQAGNVADAMLNYGVERRVRPAAGNAAAEVASTESGPAQSVPPSRSLRQRFADWRASRAAAAVERASAKAQVETVGTEQLETVSDRATEKAATTEVVPTDAAPEQSTRPSRSLRQRFADWRSNRAAAAVERASAKAQAKTTRTEQQAEQQDTASDQSTQPTQTLIQRIGQGFKEWRARRAEAADQKAVERAARELDGGAEGNLNTKWYQVLRKGWMGENKVAARIGVTGLAVVGAVYSAPLALTVGTAYLLSGRIAGGVKWFSNKTGLLKDVANWMEDKVSRPKTPEQNALHQEIRGAKSGAEAAAKSLKVEAKVTTQKKQVNRAGWIFEHPRLAGLAGVASLYGTIAMPLVGVPLVGCYLARGWIASGLQKIAPASGRFRRFADGFKSFVSRPSNGGERFETALKEGKLGDALNDFAENVSSLSPEQVKSQAKAAAHAAAKRIGEVDLTTDNPAVAADLIAIRNFIANTDLCTVSQAQALVEVLNGNLANTIATKRDIASSFPDLMNRIYRNARARVDGGTSNPSILRYQNLREAYNKAEVARHKYELGAEEGIFGDARTNGNLAKELVNFKQEARSFDADRAAINEKSKSATNAIAKRIQDIDLASASDPKNRNDFIAILDFMGNRNICSVEQAEALLGVINSRLEAIALMETPAISNVYLDTANWSVNETLGESSTGRNNNPSLERFNFLFQQIANKKSGASAEPPRVAAAAVDFKNPESPAATPATSSGDDFGSGLD